MPKLTVEGFNTVEVETGMRLVNAIEQKAGVDILHACGGNARCTTCRIEFVIGEPHQMTRAEKTRLEEKGLSNVRLSCQSSGCDVGQTCGARTRPSWAHCGQPRESRHSRRFSQLLSGFRKVGGGLGAAASDGETDAFRLR